jgi:FdrA protein
MTLRELLAGKPVFVNVGVADFADSLEASGFDVVRVEWTPPAGGDAEVAALLDGLL